MGKLQDFRSFCNENSYGHDFVVKLRTAIQDKIKELKADGTVSISLNNLKQLIRMPGIVGVSNSAWQYQQLFKEAVSGLDAKTKSFITGVNESMTEGIMANFQWTRKESDISRAKHAPWESVKNFVEYHKVPVLDIAKVWGEDTASEFEFEDMDMLSEFELIDPPTLFITSDGKTTILVDTAGYDYARYYVVIDDYPGATESKPSLVRCMTCGELVEFDLEKQRQHLESHNPGAANFDAEEVAEEFEDEDL
jgi:hypothetical protein